MALPKVYFIQFGSGDARTFSGLHPTFLIFATSNGATLTPPTISEVNSGWGNYGFTYTFSSTLAVYFQADGATTGLSSSNRYVSGVLDPVQAIDQQINGLTSIVSGIGTNTDSIGTNSSDPLTVFGYLRRNLEISEGDQVFTSAGGTLQIYNRTALGTTTLLRTKTLTNLGQTVTKTGD